MFTDFKAKSFKDSIRKKSNETFSVSHLSVIVPWQPPKITLSISQLKLTLTPAISFFTKGGINRNILAKLQIILLSLQIKQ